MHAQKLATLGAMALVAALVAAAPARAGIRMNGSPNGIDVNGLPVNGVGETAFHANALSLHGLTLRDGRRLVVSK